MLGDPVNHSDNLIFSNKKEDESIEMGLIGAPDDRWVFTEENPKRTLSTASALAASARVLKSHNSQLAADCLKIAEEIWNRDNNQNDLHKVGLAVELLLSTKNTKYVDYLISKEEEITANIEKLGWIVGPILPLVKNEQFFQNINDAVKIYLNKIQELEKETPYGVPYKPNIWGAGWGIQHFGVQQYYLHRYYPEIFPKDYMLNAMNFILGVHPGVNTSSFASGVGSKSLTQAYGVNRGEFSFIPGGIGSGTALIRPDFPELLEWPFLWQQTEYVLGGGTTDYMFLILAANKLFNPK